MTFLLSVMCAETLADRGSPGDDCCRGGVGRGRMGWNEDDAWADIEYESFGLPLAVARDEESSELTEDVTVSMAGGHAWDDRCEARPLESSGDPWEEALWRDAKERGD